nr:ethylene-responsive transcription factor TINY-like [Ipomoea trifida]
MDILLSREPTAPEPASSSSSEIAAEPSQDELGEIVELPELAADTTYDDFVFPDWDGWDWWPCSAADRAGEYYGEIVFDTGEFGNFLWQH